MPLQVMHQRLEHLQDVVHFKLKQNAQLMELDALRWLLAHHMFKLVVLLVLMVFAFGHYQLVQLQELKVAE